MYSAVGPHSGRPQSFHSGTTAMAMQGMFLHDAVHSGQVHAQHPGKGRRQEDTGADFRSPLLEEFRNAKDRKWALKVGCNNHVLDHLFTVASPGYLRPCGRIQR
jgi:hypothetical protein